jgi:hypothetical protein
MKLNLTERNALQSVKYLLRITNVKVSSIGLREELCLHPDFPSLVAVSDALSQWGISNLATRLNRHQLKEIPLPALAYLNVRGGVLSPILAVDSEYVEWIDTLEGRKKESLSSFEQVWDGTTLLIEANGQSGEVNFDGNHKQDLLTKFRALFLVLGSLTCLVLLLNLKWDIAQSEGLNFYILLCTKLSGIILSGLLVWQSMDANSPIMNKICHFGNGSDCNSILQTSAAKVTSWLSWADVGLIYFLGGIITLFFALLDNISVVHWLSVLSILSLPYTVYSVWFQYYVVKRWCPLCVSVQVLLWIESYQFINQMQHYSFALESGVLKILIISFTIAAIVWTTIKKPLTDGIELFDLKRELQKIKYNEDYIQHIFRSAPKIVPIFEDMNVLTLGNPKSKNVLTVVTNPLCRPCSIRHEEINSLIESFTDIQCRFIFLGSPEALDIASVVLNSGKHKQRELINSWYQNIDQNREEWIKKNTNTKESNETTFQLHRRWCDLANVTVTPTVFLNGVKLPDAYEIKDITKLTRHLSDSGERELLIL